MRCDNTIRSGRRKPVKHRGTPAADRVGHVAGALIASPVIQRVPAAVRRRLDRALFQRTGRGLTLEQVAQELDLGRFGVSMDNLTGYAAALDELIRPVASAQIVAGMLGCLPASLRARILRGNQVLLLSKLQQVLWESQASVIEAGELVKLATVLKSAAHRRRRKGGTSKKKNMRADEALFDEARMAEAVRSLYGLTWPPAQTRMRPADSKTAPAPQP